MLESLSRWELALAVYGLASAATFVAYGLDKGRATKGQRRIPEISLHMLALCGGWPGALLGMRAFRHKSAKIGFRLVTYAITALHAAGWALFLVARFGAA